MHLVPADSIAENSIKEHRLSTFVRKLRKHGHVVIRHHTVGSRHPFQSLMNEEVASGIFDIICD